MSKNILFLSDTVLKERSTIHTNIDPKLYTVEIKEAQDMYIKPALGSALFDRLQTAVNANTFTPDEDKLLDEYILPALSNYVLMAIPFATTFQYSNKGVVRRAGENVESLSMDELLNLSERHKNKAEFYRDELTRHLKAKASTTYFPEYINAGSDPDTVHPNNDSYTSPIYLGGDDCGCSKYY